jgi:hypothetical protein
MGLAIDLRIKTSNVGIPLFQCDSKVRTIEDNSSTKECYETMNLVY